MMSFYGCSERWDPTRLIVYVCIRESVHETTLAEQEIGNDGNLPLSCSRVLRLDVSLEAQDNNGLVAPWGDKAPQEQHAEKRLDVFGERERQMMGSEDATRFAWSRLKEREQGTAETPVLGCVCLCPCLESVKGEVGIGRLYARAQMRLARHRTIAQ